MPRVNDQLVLLSLMIILMMESSNDKPLIGVNFIESTRIFDEL